MSKQKEFKAPLWVAFANEKMPMFLVYIYVKKTFFNI